MGKVRRFKMANKGLRYKLMIAFSLMSIIPILACTYAFSAYLFPESENLVHISVVIAVSLIIAALGLMFARQLVDPVIDMAIEAKLIASGEYNRKVTVASEDEVGNLGQSINAMTQKIKTNLDEIKNYGQKMREVNIEIHKKVLALSSLLQIGDIISAGSVQIDSVLDMALEKSCMIFDTGYGVLFTAKGDTDDYVIKSSCNLDKEKFGDLVIKKEGHGIIEKSMEDRSVVLLDNGTKPSKETENFKLRYELKNIIIIPLYSGRKDLGILLVGNREDDFRFKIDDVDLVKVFAKQMTIAIESDILTKKSKELSITDDLTDLYNKNFILSRMEEEIKRAIFYQRPCSFILFNIDDFNGFREKYGEIAAEEALKKLAKAIKDNVTAMGKAARISGDEFAVLLPERNKKEATLIAGEIKGKIEATNLLKEGKATLTVSGGVSENPLDGSTGDELFKKAIEALKQARTSGKGAIVA